MPRFLFALLLPVFCLAAETTACSPSPEVTQALGRITSLPEPRPPYFEFRAHRIDQISKVLAQFPDDVFVHEQLQDTLRLPSVIERDEAIRRYEALARERALDARYQYLLGRLLIGYQTARSIELLEHALATDETFAPPLLELGGVYSYPAFRDDKKSAAYFSRFMEMCPDSLEVFYRLDRAADDVFKQSATLKLRALLENNAAGRGRYYPLLWKLEAQSGIASRVRGDVKKLRAMPQEPDLLAALREAYRLLSDPEGLNWVEEQTSRSPLTAKEKAIERVRLWIGEHPAPAPQAGIAPARAYYELLFREWARWMAEISDEPLPFTDRLKIARILGDVSAAEVRQTGEALLPVADRLYAWFSPTPPLKIEIAQTWAEYGVRLNAIPQLVQAGFREVETLLHWQPSDLYLPERADRLRLPIMRSYWAGWSALAETYSRTGRLTKAKEVLSRLRASLDEYKALALPAEEASYWRLAGRVSERAKRRADAFVAYERAFNQIPAGDLLRRAAVERDMLRVRPRAVGVKEGQRAWMNAAPAETPSGWRHIHLPLQDFHLVDLQGRSWSVAALAGKATLINVWATWCGPCRLELPWIERLYRETQGRTDIAVITLNVDEQPGAAQHYWRENGFTFPVIPARAYVEALLPGWTIPCNWIVNRDGTRVRERMGYAGDAQKWIAESLDILTATPASGSERGR